MCGISAVILNGNMQAKVRASVIDQFKTDPAVRVLLMSSVGMVGLNLTCADMVIAYVSTTIGPLCILLTLLFI